MKVSNLKINPSNPRIIKDDKFKKLVKSIKDFPEMLEKRPIVCVTDVDGKIYPLGGNMRLKALQELGYKEIPDNYILMADEWTEEQRREFLIKDNVGFGEWDWDILANEWDAEKLEEWGLDVPNWSKGIDANNMNEEDIDIEEEFDPIGNAAEQAKIVIICKNETTALKYISDNLPDNTIYKRQANAGNLQFNIIFNE